MNKNISTYIVDSFTSEAFKGNPAGVCLLQNTLDHDSMLSIAKELGFSETAFVTKLDQKGDYTIRYFSPKLEIPLCGHATLAASKVLFETVPNLDQIRFLTTENLTLEIIKEKDKVVMKFPTYKTTPVEAPKPLLNALSISEILNSEYNSETNILLIEIESSQVLRGISPDFTALINSHSGINGVLVTAKSMEPEYDFESRYFWPWSGTLEDPVTGGTHTFLAPYWGKKLNKSEMTSFQCSERTGFMELIITKDSSLLIKGSAVIVFKGHLLI